MLYNGAPIEGPMNDTEGEACRKALRCIRRYIWYISDDIYDVSDWQYGIFFFQIISTALYIYAAPDQRTRDYDVFTLVNTIYTMNIH